MAVDSPFFIDVLAGKERRVRPIEGTNLEFGQCSPLLGLKAGLAKRFSNDVEIAAGVGIALSLRNADDDDEVREHAGFVDVEVNKYFGARSAFVGAGLSFWDFTRSDTRTPAVLAHFGVPLGANTGTRRYYFLGEGRAFLDNADDIKSNYLLWGGLRVHF